MQPKRRRSHVRFHGQAKQILPSSTALRVFGSPRLFCISVIAVIQLGACDGAHHGVERGEASVSVDRLTRNEIPIFVEQTSLPLRSAFISVKGHPFLTDEFGTTSAEVLATRHGRFQDRNGGEWRRWRTEEVSLSAFIADFIFRSVRISEPVNFHLYTDIACGAGCTLQIWASPTMEWPDTRNPEPSWENNPDDWHFVEVELRHDERLALTGLREFNPDTAEVVVGIGGIVLSFDGQSLTARFEEVSVRGIDVAAARNLPSNGPDAGFERTPQERE